ncbi:MAG: LAGLIDADG family homing endonuclease, partial [Nanoarchaeota archaeon]
QKHQLHKLIRQLRQFRGRHTELVTVYVPAGYDLNKIIQHLQQEQGTATNIKDARTRKNVIDSLEKAVRHLRLYKKTPDNGLAIFSGNISDQEGKIDIQVFWVEPPEPLLTRMYRCDQRFILEPLESMVEHKEVYGLIVMDRREANLGLLKGTYILPVATLTSGVPGKYKTGGQCGIFGSLVQLAEGGISKIENLHNPLWVKSADLSNYKLKDSPITDKWKVKKQEVYKIITKNPRLVAETSKDHVFFVLTPDGMIEKTAEELKVGDTLIMPEQISINGSLQKLNSDIYYNSFTISKAGQKLLKQKRLEKGFLQRQLARNVGIWQNSISEYEIGGSNAKKETLERVCIELEIDFKWFLKNYTKHHNFKTSSIKLPDKLTPELAQFIGYLIGDGNIETDRIAFSEQDKQVSLYYKYKFDKYFKAHSSYRFRENKNYHQLRFTSRPLVRLIRKEFPEVKKALDSEVPEKIMKSESTVVSAFLRGIFDAEGYASKNGHLGIGMNNKTLIQQLQLLLLRFSIISSFLEYDNRRNIYSNNYRYSLQISEKKSLELFRKYVGFSSTKKSNKLNSITSKKSNTSYVRQIIKSGSSVRELLESHGYKLTMFPKVSNFFRNKRMMSKTIFRNSILSNIKDRKLYNKLEDIHNYPLLPVKIKDIRIINKLTEMVDIAVKNQNFILNGLLVHNSAARFARIREGMAKEFYKRIAEEAKKEFLQLKELKGIIIGGPGPTKYEFHDGDYLITDLKKKVIGIKDITYTDESGLNELVEKGKDLLEKEAITKEKKLMERFLEALGKSSKVTYGFDDVKKALEANAVELLLVSESIEE